MAVFTPRALQIPNMRTDYSAENSAVSNAAQTLGNMPSEFRKEQLNAQKQQILGQIGTGNLDYDKAGRALIALGDTQAGATLLGLGQKQQDRDLEKTWMGGGAGTTAAATPMALGSPNEVESRFLGGVQKAGLTNPNGLAAVAAYGKSESGYSPGNVNKTWSDPSESGAPGTSGGIMSWRAERLQNLQNFARQRGEQGNGSPETQAAFLAQEDPTLVSRLNAAKTPQEANQIMADAWRFAGYNRPGQGEFARREGLTGAYAQRYAGAQPALSPAQPVQVAENEADVQRLEQQQARAPDVPAPGAANAQGFAIPGGESEYQQRSILSDKNVQYWQNRLNIAPTERTRAIAQNNLGLAVKDAEQRFAEGKAPEAVREWQWARKNGLTDARSPVAYAKEKADATRQDSAPTTRTVKQADGSEVIVQWNGETKTWDPLAAPKGGEAVRPTGTKLTESQSKDLIYHSRGLQALEAFEPNANAYASGVERLAVQAPGGNYVVSEEFQKARNAGRNFLASVLRKDTGAAVTKAEEDLYGDIFLPSPGDKPGTLAQKTEARKQAIDAIRSGLGTAEVLALGKRLTTRQPGEGAPAPAASPLNTPQQNQPTSTPNPTATGPNGQRLMWDGKAWVPFS